MTVTDLPSLNAALNSVAALLLLAGYRAIRRGHQDLHKKIMLGALATSAAFLVSYLIYHAEVGSVPYPRHDWTRPLYFAILVPHVILAGGMVPFIFLAVWHAFRGNFRKHTRLTRWVWPVWLFVSVTGVVIYVMLYGLS